MKFVLFFVAICLIAQVCYAEENRRVLRDVAEEAQKAIDSAGDTLKGIFNEDTWNKVVAGAKEFGDNVKKVADDIVQKVSEKSSSAPATPTA